MRPRQTLLAGLGIAILTAVAYAAVSGLGFVPLDDPGYIYENPHVTAGLTAAGVRWAFTTGFLANWHPLTWISHMLDVEWFALDAGRHHVTSLVLHIANALVLFGLLYRMTNAVGRSAFVAALFAVHPLHVESVAWLSERKDVLSTLFWLLTMCAYVWFVKGPGVGRYLLVTICFALGLMAKPMLVTLPLVLLLVDRWPLARAESISRLILEKAPLLSMAAASGVVTFLVQRAGGAVTSAAELPLGLRVENALVSYAEYIARMVVPVNLGAFYPYPSSIPVFLLVSASAMLVAISWGVWRFGRRYPYLPFGWWWFVVTLVPVIGIVQVGTQATADRYTYVPLIGLFVMAAWGGRDLLHRWPAHRVALPAAAMAILLACTVLTRAQVPTWKDGWSMWSNALAVTRDNARAQNAVGVMVGEQGRTTDAAEHFREALRIEPNFPEANRNLGVALASQGKVPEAVSHFQAAIRFKPDFADAHRDLADAFFALRRNADALSEYATAVRLQPDFAGGHVKYGFALAADGRPHEAVTELAEAVRLEPGSESARLYLGMALGAAGRIAEARQQFTEVLRINPANEGAKRGLERTNGK
jgi:Tfp pilus assembly protein PilF